MPSSNKGAVEHVERDTRGRDLELFMIRETPLAHRRVWEPPWFPGDRTRRE